MATKKRTPGAVAAGNQQAYGTYDETYAGRANIRSARTMWALATELDWDMHILDVKKPYVQGKADKLIIARLPRILGRGGESGLVKLVKSLYRLKQVGHLWFQLAADALQKDAWTESLSMRAFTAEGLTVILCSLCYMWTISSYVDPDCRVS